jgi:hypothetical protein
MNKPAIDITDGIVNITIPQTNNVLALSATVSQ